MKRRKESHGLHKLDVFLLQIVDVIQFVYDVIYFYVFPMFLYVFIYLEYGIGDSVIKDTPQRSAQ
jgi:hypothetical protein